MIRTFEVLMHRVFKIFLTTGIALCSIAGTAAAQALLQVTGITYNNKTSDRIAQVSVTNLQKQAMATSNDQGTFKINAAINDTLLFSKAGFTEQRLVVKEAQMLVFMVPAQQLEDVVVKAKTKQQEQSEVMNTYRSKGIYYDGKPPVLSFLASPLTGLYELFGKEPSRARHFAQVMKRENQQTEINKRYTRDLVKRVTKLPDNEVSIFMLAYSPPYPEMLKWNDYELIQFINRSMRGYKANRPQTALQ
jgi:hypothetical protein